MPGRCPRYRRACRAQAMTEMLVLVTLVVVGTGLAMSRFLDHVGTFYTAIIELVSIPIP